MSEWSYDRWRQTIPFSDDQISDALRFTASEYESSGISFMATVYRTYADRLQANHRLQRRVLNLALPVLINRCRWCSRKALYRNGNDGACRAHKDNLVNQRRHMFRTKVEPGLTQKERDVSEWDRNDRLARKHHRARGVRR